MTMFIKIEDGVPVGSPITEENFLQAINQTITKPITPESIADLGFGIYEFQKRPYLERYEKLEEAPPIKKPNGIFYQNWKIIDMNDEEKKIVDDNKATAVRIERDQKLFESDWTQLNDAPVTDEEQRVWKQYRADLRKVTEQPGFPWVVEWPIKP